MKSMKSIILGLILTVSTPVLSVASAPVFAPLPTVSAQIQTNQARAQAALDSYWAGLQSNNPTVPAAKKALIATAPVSPTQANTTLVPVPATPKAPAVASTPQPNVTVVVVNGSPATPSTGNNSVTRVVTASASFVKNHLGIDIAIVMSALILAIIIEWKRVLAFFTTLYKIFTVKKPVPTPVTPAPITPVVVTPTSVTTSIPAGTVTQVSESVVQYFNITGSVSGSASSSVSGSGSVS